MTLPSEQDWLEAVTCMEGDVAARQKVTEIGQLIRFTHSISKTSFNYYIALGKLQKALFKQANRNGLFYTDCPDFVKTWLWT